MSGSSRAYGLSPRAEIDLEDIWLYTLERWSAEQADRYQNEIISALEALTKGDESGRRVISARAITNIRSGRISFLRLSDRRLDVIRVLHQRMDVESHL